MTAFTMIVILGVLMIVGGISLMATPLLTFVGAGYFIIILFFISGIFGIARAISEKRYDKDFFLSILSLILGIIGFVVPGAAAMNNSVMLYMAAGWFIIHGVFSIINTFADRHLDGLMKVVSVILGVLEIVMGIYSIFHPAVMAISLGFLIGMYYIETGVNTIVIGSLVCEGGNNVTVLFTVMGLLTLFGGVSMLFTPLLTFLGTGGAIIMLFFIHGVAGIVRGISDRSYDRDFLLSILSLILGIIGLVVPGAAAMNNSILLYLAACWFIVRGVLSIIAALKGRKEGDSTGIMILRIVLGALEIIMGIYSLAHPAVLAISLGILISFYFIESGVSMIFLGSEYSRAVAYSRRRR